LLTSNQKVILAFWKENLSSGSSARGRSPSRTVLAEWHSGHRGLWLKRKTASMSQAE